MMKLTDCYGMGRSPFLVKEEARCPLHEAEAEAARETMRRVEAEIMADRRRGRKPSVWRRLKQFLSRGAKR
jgi:hypothetical protein